MTYTFYAYTKIKEKSIRMTLQLIAMIMFLITIFLEMIYSNYYMLVLLTPFLIFLYNYIRLKKRQFYYSQCRVLLYFTKDIVRLQIDQLPEKDCCDCIVPYTSIEHIDFFNNGNVIIICKNILDKNNKRINKNTFDFMFEITDKDLLQEVIESILES